MNPESILENLEPLRQPDPVSWWPPAPGWWLLAALVAAASFFAVRALLRRHRRGAPLREAKLQVALLVEETPSAAQLCADLNQLQRRVAIAVRGRPASAGLTGRVWAQFLNELTQDGETYFDERLVTLAHRAQVSDADGKDFLEATQRWIDKLERPR